MNRTLAWLIGIALTLCLAACGKSNETVQPQAPTPPRGTVFDDTIATKNRAKQGTDQAMEQNKEKLDAEMKKLDEESAAP
jgi:thiamine biosynthesis lipoprotein ApbE